DSSLIVEDPTLGNTVILAVYVVVWMDIGNNKDEEHHAHTSNLEKMILEHIKVMREQLTERGGALKRMSVKLTEMMAETMTFRDLQVTVLANTQEEPQGEEKKLIQEISQFGSSIHDLQGLLNEKVGASEAQLQSVGDTSQ
ncbi:hypothetical protein HAX54_029299, partial [Datura stramonium]|nr:hypothetical protein [Datura stramonium]